MIQVTLPNAPEGLEVLTKALDSGIGWIVLPEKADEELVQQAERLCREKGIILTVTDNVPLLEDKRYHGILFTRSRESIPELRKRLGAHPIVGVAIKPGEEFLHMKPWDIDYFVVETDAHPLPEVTQLLARIKGAWDIPVVAYCRNAGNDDIDRLIEIGFDGVNVENIL